VWRCPIYKVLIDDNFHFQDESERVTHGTFDTADKALAACRRVVDEFLAGAYKLGMSSPALYEQYTLFGDDPFIVSCPSIRKPHQRSILALGVRSEAV
jgi:hypothetical protein